MTYAERSRFLAPIQLALQEQLNSPVVTVQFMETRDGYSGTVEIILPGETPRSFSANWMGKDATRFPARLKAAATALKQAGFNGHFRLSHRANQLTIEQLS